MSVAATEVPLRAGRMTRMLRGMLDLVVGGLLCLTPVTAILAQGWIMRRMNMSVALKSGEPAVRPGWLLGPRGAGAVARVFGGLARNIREGLSATLSLALMTLPFSIPWLLAWWAGWDNSFNKGYEQAWAGPAVFLSGVGIFLVVMHHLPMALAHQAATGRWLAVFEWRQVRRATRHTGWGAVFLALATVLAALPLFGRRGLPVFVEDIVPGFAEFTPDQLATFMDTVNLATAAYVFAAMLFLRLWSARIYAAAMIRADAGRGRMRLGRLVRTAVIAPIWFGLLVLIVVAQFLNHSWWVWVQHPAFALPWWG